MCLGGEAQEIREQKYCRGEVQEIRERKYFQDVNLSGGQPDTITELLGKSQLGTLLQFQTSDNFYLCRLQTEQLTEVIVLIKFSTEFKFYFKFRKMHFEGC